MDWRQRTLQTLRNQTIDRKIKRMHDGTNAKRAPQVINSEPDVQVISPVNTAWNGPSPLDGQAFAKHLMNIELTDDQAFAWNKLMDWVQDVNGSDWINLRGFAGTGKTTLVQLLSKALQVLNFRVIGLAPTHKAVRVLASKVSCDTATVHSSSGLKMEELEDGTRATARTQCHVLRQFHFALLDECSMSGRELTSALEEARGSCRIIAIGDPAQFNPVGEMEQSPTFSMGPKVVLKQITRQAEGNPLIIASKKVRVRIRNEERVDLEDLTEWLDESHFVPRKTLIKAFIKAHKAGKDVRILAYRNKIVVAHNQAIHFALYPDTKDMFCVGEPVIAHEGYTPLKGDSKDLPIKNSFEFVIRNVRLTTHPVYTEFKAWRLELGNDLEPRTGYTTVYVPWSDSEYEAEISRRFDEVREFESQSKWNERRAALKRAWDFKNGWALIRHAYALTAHKSQGSTFDLALVDLPDMDYIREDFEHGRALYVALTRPREKTRFIL